MSQIECSALTVGFRRSQPVLDEFELNLHPDQITALVGPNGSGKSTLLSTITRVLAPQTGSVLLDGQQVHQAPTRQIARQLALLSQGAVIPEDLRVTGLVAYGRYPHLGRLAGLSQQDHAIIDASIDRTGLRPLADRRVDSLSGGERQRAWVACALAQQTRWLMLDEPTTYLDLGHQVSIMRLLRTLHDDDGLALLMVLHDLGQAATYADRIVVLQAGKIVADGAPHEVITPDLVCGVFHTEVDVIEHPRTGRPLVIPRP